MSWDVFLMHLPPEISRIEEINESSSFGLGEKSEVLSRLVNILPEIKFQDSSWGSLDTKEFSIEFNIGDDDPVDSILLHIRGGDSAIDAIDKLCQSTGWRAIAITTGDFISFDHDPIAGLQKWRAYRDQVLKAKATGSLEQWERD